MTRQMSRYGIRAASVALLVAGTITGVYVGQNRQDQEELSQAASITNLDMAESYAADMQLLKQRQNEHAAARSWQRQAEGQAATRAATEAKAAASKAKKIETQVIAAKKADEARKKAIENGGPVPYDGPIPSSCSEYSGSRAIGCTLTLSAGFGLDQFPCLEKLWTKESGWNYKAANPSGAYGIPQALPGSKMASAGSDWKTSPATQIKWGLGYVKGRYSTPCGAWSYFQAHNNY
ncbi:transglycosylase SLT domain-containing protein [Winogradskya consettensis]|uniref:Lytic transglycosylase domain-containing protein n=1 Tax=Winogradskya consettensis TaxID=113560 RepID=A0A919VPV9_9ACTN|nr:hypothetical protein Aco04nite_25820 [Actinoplanes consettensis]